MSKIGLRLKINVSNIDKNRLFRGKKGAYLDATVFVDLDNLDQYDSSGMITQDVSKEEKQQGVNGNILGNCKVFWKEQQQAQQQQSYNQNNQALQQNFNKQPQQQNTTVDFDDDIPF